VPEPLPRLIDLRVLWPWQYIGETTQFHADAYPPLANRVRQLAGYLQDTSAAVVACARSAEDWSRQADPWAALNPMITRVEAEFPGRLLIGPEDHARWIADPQGLTYALIGVAGFDALIRNPVDLDRLARLFERGVRLFQPVQGPTSLMAGSSAPGDDRGLTHLGRMFLQTLLDLTTDRPGTPRPLVDLTGLGPVALGQVLSWFEADGNRSRRLRPLLGHGSIRRSDEGAHGAISLEHFDRLRALGGVVGLSVGPPHHATAEDLRGSIEAAIERTGPLGFEGFSIGTGFLGLERAAPGLENAEAVVAWLRATFQAPAADLLIQGNARRLLECAVGVS
jgi:membrane dipeptidase